MTKRLIMSLFVIYALLHIFLKTFPHVRTNG